MLGFLFPGLTARPERGAALFDKVTAIARQPHWYRDGGVADTIDGRFRMLATVAALFVIRLEQAGAAGQAASVALTERFVEVMESEHRELGLGDPTLGKTVRKLVALLAQRVEWWREAIDGGADWAATARRSLALEDAGDAGLAHSAEALAAQWRALADAADRDVVR